MFALIVRVIINGFDEDSEYLCQTTMCCLFQILLVGMHCVLNSAHYVLNQFLYISHMKTVRVMIRQFTYSP